MKEIPLTQGQTAIVDDEEYDFLLSINEKWYAWKSRNTFYAGCKSLGKLVIMHRVIMNAQAADIVDHIDRNGTHNWKENLRLTDHAGNMQNKGIYKNNTSGVSGVYYTAPARGRPKWVAQITHAGKQTCLGKFTTMEEAVNARLTAEKELFK